VAVDLPGGSALSDALRIYQRDYCLRRGRHIVFLSGRAASCLQDQTSLPDSASPAVREGLWVNATSTRNTVASDLNSLRASRGGFIAYPASSRTFRGLYSAVFGSQTVVLSSPISAHFSPISLITPRTALPPRPMCGSTYIPTMSKLRASRSSARQLTYRRLCLNSG
jgi:hypothetical protein